MVHDPDTVRRLDAHEWRYSREDPAALEQIRGRIDARGRRRGVIFYSELVEGIEFQLPSVWTAPHSIDVHDWPGIEREILLDFLSCISADSYRQHDFMASALVVGEDRDQPGELFFEWLKFLQILPNMEHDTVSRF